MKDFKCITCGKCCRGYHTQVNLNGKDIKRLARHLNVDVTDLKKKLLRRDLSNEWMIPAKNGQCPFFIRALKRCAIYEARPDACRQFPFFFWKTPYRKKDAPAIKRHRHFCAGSQAWLRENRL